MTNIRWDYKSSLFCHLFGDEECKGNALELYNALSGQNLADPAEITITTIGDAVFLGRKNDVSFLVGGEMVLWEHQTTHNPNMPLRGLLYFARLLTKLIEDWNLDIYGTTPVELPTPRYVVFYFGESKRPEREVMKLSDSFTAGPGDVEMTATVLNCNEGNNKAIMEACEALRGYSRLVSLERTLRRHERLESSEAAKQAVERCIKEGYLSEYLIRHRAEVVDMLFTIQDEERAMRVHREAIAREAKEEGWAEGMEKGLVEGMEKGIAEGMEKGLAEGREKGLAEGVAQGRAEGVAQGRAEGRAEGLAEGVEQGRADTLVELVKANKITIEDAAEILNLTAEQVAEMAI